MADPDKIPFGPNEVAFEILEAWFGVVRERLDDYGVAADTAATLNQFYGLNLTPVHLQELRTREMGIDDLARIIEPMRQWPAMMGYPALGSDCGVELPELRTPSGDN